MFLLLFKTGKSQCPRFLICNTWWEALKPVRETFWKHCICVSCRSVLFCSWNVGKISPMVYTRSLANFSGNIVETFPFFRRNKKQFALQLSNIQHDNTSTPSKHLFSNICTQYCPTFKPGITYILRSLKMELTCWSQIDFHSNERERIQISTGLQVGLLVHVHSKLCGYMVHTSTFVHCLMVWTTLPQAQVMTVFTTVSLWLQNECETHT